MGLSATSLFDVYVATLVLGVVFLVVFLQSLKNLIVINPKESFPYDWRCCLGRALVVIFLIIVRTNLLLICCVVLTPYLNTWLDDLCLD